MLISTLEVYLNNMKVFFRTLDLEIKLSTRLSISKQLKISLCAFINAIAFKRSCVIPLLIEEDG